MTITDRDLLALLLLLDEGDDGVLPAVADRLEELCDTRHEGLRLVGGLRPGKGAGQYPDTVFIWRWDAPPHPWDLPTWKWDRPVCQVSRKLLERLTGSSVTAGYFQNPSCQWGWKGYPTRSAAFIALSVALHPRIRHRSDDSLVEYRRRYGSGADFALEGRVLRPDGTPHDSRWYPISDAELLNLNRAEPKLLARL